MLSTPRAHPTAPACADPERLAGPKGAAPAPEARHAPGTRLGPPRGATGPHTVSPAAAAVSAGWRDDRPSPRDPRRLWARLRPANITFKNPVAVELAAWADAILYHETWTAWIAAHPGAGDVLSTGGAS